MMAKVPWEPVIEDSNLILSKWLDFFFFFLKEKGIN